MTITLSQARQVVDASLAKGRELGLKPLSVVVLDTRGSLVAALSEDGCAQLRPKVAHGKANAAIGLGMGTRALMDRAEQQAYFVQAVNGVLGGDMVPVPGGVLIRTAEGELVGAVGISGDTSDNDEAAALAGIAAAGLTAQTE
ncbi:MAG: heme-binding protein [Pseudomonadota bacterium]|nr:heme-binding protein [Pseudomonadota bacterium]MEC7495247.1 heme-binding protein [Pseudomonadota bacterium]MEC7650292.1 heme-binding protein [Pseudomonadota bacterium]MEC7853642.1 heme-binding protein [Pseudomonadota bacterium]MEC8712483.1 heme-binding protein [Pseudomonadota bacterium]